MDCLPRPYSSREFILEMGKFLKLAGKNIPSIVQTAYEKDIPIFLPCFQ